MTAHPGVFSARRFAELRDPSRREHFVYRAYDATGRLLYVGCTMRPKQRWAEHRMWSEWAPFAVRFRVVGPLNYDTARALERDALRTEQPVHGCTPERRGAHSRAAAESRRRLRQFIEQGLSLSEACTAASAVSA